jgi:hypothetical protein
MVAAATATCGLFVLSGLGPSPAGAELSGDPVAAVDQIADDSTTTTTTTTTTATTTTTTTTTLAPEAPNDAERVPDVPPIPLSVSPSTVVVGVGGTARISGTCPLVDGVPRGPVEIWQVGQSMVVIPTGVTAEAWSYDWTSPDAAQPLVLQVWCGDPSSHVGGYPAAMQIQVEFVAQQAPPSVASTTTLALDPVIPETD